MRRPVALVLTLLALAAEPRPGAGEEDPLAAQIRAVLLEDDAGLRKVYDGVRKGLELAQLPRVSLDALDDTAGAFRSYAKRVEETRPPLVFFIGRRACERAVEAGVGGARVFVDTAVAVRGRDLPAAPTPAGRAAVVRGVVPASRWNEVVRGMFPGRTTYPVRLPWADASIADAVIEDTGLALSADDASTRPGPLLLSDDVGRWGKGAVVILSVDHRLLGRSAAEAGRRLLAGEGEERLEVTVGATEVRVDLDAADAAGLRLPLPFVAAADAVRARPGRGR